MSMPFVHLVWQKDGKLVYFSICNVKKVNCILFLLLTYLYFPSANY